MKTKSKILISAILAVVFCVSMIAGATFAIFTSTSNVNIAITSGKVNVKAAAEITDVASPSAVSFNNGFENETDATATDDDVAEYQGKVTVGDKTYDAYYFNHTGDTGSYDATSYAYLDDSGAVQLVHMAAGDSVTLQLSIENSSNVAAKYRYILEEVTPAQPDDSDKTAEQWATDSKILCAGLNISLLQGTASDTNTATTYTSMISYRSAWADMEADKSPDALTVTLELPVTAGNDYQDLSTSLKFTVVAVQGNAVADEESLVKKYFRVNTLSDINNIAYSVQPNNTEFEIVLDSNIYMNKNTEQIKVKNNVTLDLNGKTIEDKADLFSNKRTSVVFVDGGSLVIKDSSGNGKIKAKDGDCYGINIASGSCLIEGGEITGNISAVQVQKGILTITGGTFKIVQTLSSAGQNGYGYLLNCIDENYTNKTAQIYVSGGTFVNYNPTKSAEKYNPSFVVEGYGVSAEEQEDGSTWYIVSKNS